jgi:phospholipid-transporting ATPase
MLNSFKARSKKSKLELQMQRQILYIFIIQITICIFCGIYYLVWYEKSKESLEYLNINQHGIVDHSPVYNFFVRIGNWILIFT